MVDVHRFKKATPNIIYQPFSNIHNDEIKKKFKQYNKLDTKIPIFAILENPNNPNHILPWHLKKWEDIQNNQFSIVGG
jgi:hypothetical protein